MGKALKDEDCAESAGGYAPARAVGTETPKMLEMVPLGSTSLH